MSRTMQRTLVVGGIVVAVHAVGIGALLLMQGCGTTGGGEAAGRPLPPVMPQIDEPPPPVAPPVAKPVLPPSPPPTITHVVVQGDYLSAIAAKYGVTTSELVTLNALKDPNKLRIGQNLVVPAGGTPRPVHKTPRKPKPAAPAVASVAVRAVDGKYTVKPGDCLSVIAVKHGVTQEALKNANSLTGDRIVVGQVLVIPEEAAAKPDMPVISESAEPVQPPSGVTGAPAAEPPVAPTDLPVEMKPAAPAGAVPAGKPPVPAASVVKPTAGAAPVVKPAAAPAPVAKPPAPVADAGTIIHEVAAGEDLYSVSLKYAVPVDELKRVNGLTGTALTEGTRLKVPILDQ